MMWNHIFIILLVGVAFYVGQSPSPEKVRVNGSTAVPQTGSEANDLTRTFNSTQSEKLSRDISPMTMDEYPIVACNVYPDFDIQLCLPNSD